jgi:pyrroline-5-carboxylate reductase
MGIDARIGIIGGAGWLGSAIAKAAVASGTVDPVRLTVSSRSRPPRAAIAPGVNWTNDNDELVERSDVVLLSVRPNQFSEVKIKAPDKLVVSVMAGVPAGKIAKRTGSPYIVRAMPNAAAAIRRSFTPWYATPPVSRKSKKLVQSLFSACGDAAEVLVESQLDYCAGLTGSGAAFPALLAEAMIAHAVKKGLPPNFARRAAKSVVAGASQLFVAEKDDTAEIVRVMMEYRGTTAAALQTMVEQGFMEAVGAGLAAAAEKAERISQGDDPSRPS